MSGAREPGSPPPAPPAAAPGDAAAVRDMVRAASAAGTPLRLAGRGTWLGAGRPVTAAASLSLASLSGIVEYVPGDLTLTARAGTPLGEIERATAAERQWLALDPFGDSGGSLGATVVTASAGPLAHAFGTPRDNVLGVEAVSGAGAIIRGGGRVVKNVAGFDLTRLLVGSWGTLAVLTEVTVRLRARPEADLTLALPLPADPDRRATALAALRRAPLQPFAVELLDAATAAAIGCEPADGPTALVRAAGNEVTVRAQERTVAALGDAREIATSVWPRLRGIEDPADAVVVRFSAPPSRFAELWNEAHTLTSPFGAVVIHGTPARGVVRCIVRRASARHIAAAFAVPSAGSRIFERLPAPCWVSLAPSATQAPLASGVRAAFDPAGVLNRGILGAVPAEGA